MNNGKENLVKLFIDSKLVSDQKAIEIATCFKEKIVLKNEFQLKAGRICNEYLFLEEGFMRAFTYDLNGNDVTTGFYAKNQMVFEVFSYFNQVISTENIQALTDCKGWYISFDQLNTLFHSIPEFREFGRSVLVKGFSALKQRMLCMINQSAEERYINLLKSSPEVFQHAPLKHIASYLGITDTSLSRIRKEFSNK